MATMAGILFDLDGVFYVGNEPVPGAVDTLEWFRQRDIPRSVKILMQLPDGNI